MKQRLGIAAALLGDPHLLLLDEPTNGLDPVGKAEMRSVLGRLASPDRSVVVSSHVLAELEQICDWLVIIDMGRLLFEGRTSELLESARTRLLLVPQHPQDLPRLGQLLARQGHKVEARDHHIAVAVDGADSHRLAAELNAAAMDGGVVLAELRVAAASLEDRYLAMVAGGTDGGTSCVRSWERSVAEGCSSRQASQPQRSQWSARSQRSSRRRQAPGLARGKGRRSIRSRSPVAAPTRSRGGIGFLGLLVLVTFAARLAGEFSHGTLRTVLMKEPRRVRVVVGKFVALMGLMAAALLVAEALSFVASVVIAPTQDVDTANWYGLDGLGEAAGDYAAAFAGTSAWALYGMTLALLLRSVAIAVAVGVAWAGPLEHITAESWPIADRWLPGSSSKPSPPAAPTTSHSSVRSSSPACTPSLRSPPGC
jgi:hypothetical protein